MRTKDSRAVLRGLGRSNAPRLPSALRLRIDTYKAEKRSLSTNALSKRLTALKQQKEQTFLREVSSVPLQQSLRHLADAFTNFFEGRAGYPQFKARHDKQSAEYTSSAFTWDGNVLHLAKMQEPLSIRWSRPLPEGATITTATSMLPEIS